MMLEHHMLYALKNLLKAAQIYRLKCLNRVVHSYYAFNTISAIKLILYLAHKRSWSTG